MEEIWRDIEGYEGLYQVSNLGRVKSFYRGIIMRPLLDHSGYLSVALHKNKLEKRFKVHRLVAKAFPEICGEWFDGAQVNHKDCNTTNNNAFNLEWCTAKYNCNYADHGQKISIANKGRKDTQEQCLKKSICKMGSKNHKSRATIQYTKDMEFVREWESANQVQRELGWSAGNITQCCNQKKGYNTAYGYIWRFK